MLAQSSCSTALRIGNGYSQTINRTGVHWFTANTYDLPMAVTYIPTNADIEKPVAYIDFQCDGPLPTDIADAIGEPGDDSYVDLPIVREFKDTIIDGKKAFTLKIEAKYRDMMSAGGISRNVQAWVKVDIQSPGSVDIQPDVVSRTCLSMTPLITIPQTIHITPDNADRVYILPLSQWQSDSVRFVWNGSHAPLEVWVAEDNCNFSTQANDPYVLAHRTIAAEDMWKLTKDSVRYLMDEWMNGGMYYVRFTSTEEADLVIEKVPEQEAEGIRLRYDTPVTVKAKDDEVFYFSKQWTATRLSTPSKHICTVYFGTDANIDTLDASTYFDKLQMDVATDGSHYLEFSDVEMEWLRNQAKDNYIYLRIITNKRISFVARVWEANDCAVKKSWQVRSGRTITFDKNKYTSDYIYRMPYEIWKGYAINVSRTGTKTFTTGMRKECSNTNPTKGNCISESYVSKSKAAEWSYDQATVDYWGQYYPPDEDGFYYWIFNFNKAAATITFTSEKPAEQEPEDEEEDCEVVITARPLIEGTGTVSISIEDKQNILPRKIRIASRKTRRHRHKR